LAVVVVTEAADVVVVPDVPPLTMGFTVVEAPVKLEMPPDIGPDVACTKL
jgi:hypothetical protein